MKAFPYSNNENTQYNWINQGMDLRDYFAAFCIQPMIKQAIEESSTLTGNEELLAVLSYNIADAMMEARK